MIIQRLFGKVLRDKYALELAEKGKEILKNPKTKKWGYLGAGALGGSLAVDGIDARVKKLKDKKREKEAKEQILSGLKKNKPLIFVISVRGRLWDNKKK
jgi:hypothetical protein